MALALEFLPTLSVSQQSWDSHDSSVTMYVFIGTPWPGPLMLSPLRALARVLQQSSVFSHCREDTSQLLPPGGGDCTVNASQNPPTQLSGLLLLKGVGRGRCGRLEAAEHLYIAH